MTQSSTVKGNLQHCHWFWYEITQDIRFLEFNIFMRIKLAKPEDISSASLEVVSKFDNIYGTPAFLD